MISASWQANMNHKYCIFLTGTISPPSDIINLVHKNTELRELDYYYAIEKWLKMPYPVVFCENSNYSSVRIKDIFSRRENSQFIQFNSSENSKSMGEAEIFKYAFEKSKLLQNSEYIVKCTGRYYVRNFQSILDFIDKKYSLKIDIWADLGRSLTHSDSRFFVFKLPFYKDHLQNYFKEINELQGIDFEHVLARGIHSGLACGLKWNFLPEPIICQGIYGTGGIKFKNDFFRIHKRKFILLFKRLAFTI